MVVSSGLNDLRAIAFQSLRRFFGRTHNGHVPGFVRIRVRLNDQHQVPAVCRRLRTLSACDFLPSAFLSF